MTARDTYNNSVKTAAATQAGTIAVAQTTFQTTIDASKSVVGYTLQNGNFANLQIATSNAITALQASRLSAEMAKQAAIQVARDTLRSTGDVAPV